VTLRLQGSCRSFRKSELVNKIKWICVVSSVFEFADPALEGELRLYMDELEVRAGS
jgi:hypothetical protein